MSRIVRPVLAAVLSLAATAPALGDDKAPTAAPTSPVSFIKEVAPILVQSCIACHNPKKSESKYIMTTFAQLAKGGQQGEDITLIPGDPDASQLIEMLRPDGQPRMPYKQDPLPPEKIAVIERWVKEGAKYDGATPTEDWVAVLRKSTPVNVPESYPVTVPITALAFSPDGQEVAASGYHEVTLWKTADGLLDRRLPGLAERIYEVAYSPDGHWMATASGDPGQFGAVTLWIAEPSGGGKPVRDLLETNDSVFAVAFSPDSKRLAAAGADRAIRIWEVESGKQVALIEDHADWILDVAFSPDGKRLRRAPVATRRARSSTSSRKNRRSPSPVTDSRSTPSPSAPTASSSPAAAKTTRSGSGTPTTTASRSVRPAASAAPCSNFSTRPTASRSSPALPTRTCG